MFLFRVRRELFQGIFICLYMFVYMLMGNFELSLKFVFLIKLLRVQ